MRAILCVLLILSFAAQAADGIKFADDYESYSVGTMPTTNWSQDGSNPMGQIVTSAADGVTGPRSGSKMARGNYDNSTFSTWAKSINSLYTNKFFIRHYFRPDQNVDTTAGSMWHISRFFNNPPYNEFLWSRSGSPMILAIYVNDNQCGSEEFIANPSTSGWHEIEEYVDVSTGTIKAWFDGVLEFNQTGCTFSGQRYTTYYTISNWGTPKPDATNYFYWDDFELFTDTGDASGCTGTMAGGDIQCAGAETPTYMPIRSSNDENWDANDYRLAA